MDQFDNQKVQTFWERSLLNLDATRCVIYIDNSKPEPSMNWEVINVAATIAIYLSRAYCIVVCAY